MRHISPSEPHPWLGLDYRDLLPGLASGRLRFTLSLTRPRECAYGQGALRVVAVHSEADPPHCVLAYERYLLYPDRRQGDENARE